MSLGEECLLMYEAAEKMGKMQTIEADKGDGNILYSEYGEAKVIGEHIIL